MSKNPDSIARESLLFGRKSLVEMLRIVPERVRSVWIAEGTKLSAELSELLNRNAVKQEAIDRQSLDRLSEGQIHQGVAAEIAPRGPMEFSELLESVDRSKPLALVALDQVSDPQNLGALFRASLALGAAGLIMTRDNSAQVTPAVRKASSAATELLPYSRVKNLSRSLEELKKAGFWIVGTACEPNAGEIEQSTLPDPAVLVFGSEGKGIRELTKKQCDVLVSIPMSGPMESLNVGHALAIVLYEFRRQSKRSH